MPQKNPVPVQIDSNMTVREIVTYFPAAEEILSAYGMHCSSCSIGGEESLDQAIGMHGYSDEETAELYDDLEQLIRDQSHSLRDIVLTEAGARAILAIMEREKRTSEVLRVTLDASGSFCLEFSPEPVEGDHTFVNESVSAVRVCVPPIALYRLSGATIDFRDDRLKLDLPEAECCKGDSASCGCKSC